MISTTMRTNTPEAKVLSRVSKLVLMIHQFDGVAAVDAPRVLNRMLARHGIAMSDVVKPSQERAVVCLGWKAPHHGALILQIVAMVLDTAHPLVNLSTTNRAMYVALSPLEHAEVIVRRAVLSRALDDHMKARATEAMNAFVMKHKLHPQPPCVVEPEPPMNPDVVEAIRKIMASP